MSLMKLWSHETPGCSACQNGQELGFEITMVFQPIVDVRQRSIWAYEALVRGTDGSSAMETLARVNDQNRYLFDQTCRVKAIELAATLGLAANGARLSVNFMPGAVYSPAACIRKTLEAARVHGFPLNALVFEITEAERVLDTPHIQRIATEYARHGFAMALDDFGAGFSGLNLLAEVPSIGIVKLDGALIRNIHENPRTASIVAAMVELCAGLGVEVIGECVETAAEYTCLHKLGIRLMQGYLFARPGYECLPAITWPESPEEVPSGPVADLQGA